ncbi:glycerate kinase [Alkalihalobacillus alcalophilus ATCC 27647 = CGMCC 1.3604]|uniref:Glycerate kinase n=1 Tax=Alkalihalobacillus alcalophilus ATCC 27647 = CGMCC 1.3604 TaxID=1218173 RepID=A0A094WQC4_ALKAL|nr:glycerate kinase [Alkalihalobacillus alcalophilus]KGA99016.1 glycerate kinase [Alkalihalobacillus alcalophilus ATCC 27647 = CGMCC 1.3604]MED1560656.1 glycerate kinase [Alkalihalobacillus alcalophilus]THG89674.1 glycerate kinase [Alkalihalobacillus alcalophilus ATCC 27647 = CGMCC 1.3604]
MKIVIAPDSFKGSLSAVEAARAMEKGIKKAFTQAETVLVPVADGGEGTLESLVAATKGEIVEVTVKGPLLQPVKAAYGVLGDGETCVVEMASASGLVLVATEERDPMLTTTYGTGELIKAALEQGYRKFILAIGGSATNDGGAGMLQALGMRLFDKEGKLIGYGGAELGRVAKIDDREFDHRIKESEFLIASDVQNPLIGINGASFVFGPQKGATSKMVEQLDGYLTRWADLIEEKQGIRLHDKPGAGAAGGIGGAFQAFFPSTTRRGIDIVIEYTELEKKLCGADFVLTGEGQIDSQTASGKTPMGVAEAAQQQGIPVFVITGSIGAGIEELYQYGITSIFSLVNAPMTLEEAMEGCDQFLEMTTEQIARTFFASYGNK